MTDEQRGWAAIITLLLIIILLAGCSHTQDPPPEPEIRIVEVKVPVVVPCKALEELGPEPVYPDTDAALASVTGSDEEKLFKRVQLIVQGRVLRIARLAQYAAARASC